MSGTPENSDTNRPLTGEDLDLSWRESLDRDVARGDGSELRGGSVNQVYFLGTTYCNHWPVSEQEEVLHNLWYLYYRGAQLFAHDSPEQDRDDKNTWEIATVSTGEVIWSELPFFVSDTTEYWVKDCETMSATQRANFSRFYAKVAAAGVGRDKLFQTALIIFRDTLETERALGTPGKEEQVGVNPGRTMKDLTVADLLPSALAWFWEAKGNIIWLTNEQWKDCPDSLAAEGGPLFKTSELGTSAAPGFSADRYIFWLKRPDQTAKEADEAGNKALSKLALSITEQMLLLFHSRDCLLKDEIEAAGEIVETTEWITESMGNVHLAFKSH
ncbi:hypothetical protein PT974_04009 [Cladobotryum mycophilum]|uniref:Uncharacterized protein n=1 Tax=Cladobotryum mycophilum TaxID=491253 RepID=A0ABR0SV03_9HYPO